MNTSRLLLKALVATLLISAEPSAQAEVLSVKEARTLLRDKGSNLTDADLKRICTASDLAELDLTGRHRLSDEGLAHLGGLRELRSLKIVHCHRVTAAAFEVIAKLPRLEELDISSSRA